MKQNQALFIGIVIVLAAVPALAELQNVIVGGSVQIRGNWWTSPEGPDSLTSRNPLFELPWTPSYRGVPGGNPLAGLRYAAQPGRLAVGSGFDWNDKGSDLRFVEQRTRLNVRADFSEQVSAFIELDSYRDWGENFRSNYGTGVDVRGTGDVELYQGYISAKELWGTPLQVSIGRQELNLGSGWLVSGNGTAPFNTGLSWDSVLVSYVTDTFNLNALYAKPYEGGAAEEDGDVDVYAAFGSYTGIENITLDAYWIWARNAISQRDTNRGLVGEALEDFLGVDDYDVSSLHTLGLRGAGNYGPFDFEAEAAYQFGDASFIGRSFANAGLLSPYGDDSAKHGAIGANLELGYTFDVAYTPRVFIGGAYFGGEDNRDLNFAEWLGAVASPFYREDASVSFNRLFSGWKYSYFLDAYGDLSNVWIGRAGVSANPTEAVSVSLSASTFQSLANYDAPWSPFRFIGTRVVPFNSLTFLSEESDSDLGWEIDLNAKYAYSEDLTFEVGYSHLFVGDGLADGNFNNNNGLAFNGGTGKDDPDYYYFQTKLSF